MSEELFVFEPLPFLYFKLYLYKKNRQTQLMVKFEGNGMHFIKITHYKVIFKLVTEIGIKVLLLRWLCIGVCLLASWLVPFDLD